MEKWPNFFIVGAPKAGTTSLYEYLKYIPGIFMSPIKEPNYFSIKTIPDNHRTKPIRDKEKYLGLFKEIKDETIIGEASPTYLAEPEAAEEIHSISPNAKILISLRDPVERTYSQYLMHVRDGQWNHSFHEQLKKELNAKIDFKNRNIGLRWGFYFDDVKKFLNVFGKTQIKIIIFEEWIKNVGKELQEIINFLDVDYKLKKINEEQYNPFFVDRNPITRYIRTNQLLTKVVKKTITKEKQKKIRDKYFIKESEKPKMDFKEREILVNHYHDDVIKLEELLGRKLPWINF